MGGADFVQWHGNYPMLARTVRAQRAGRRAPAEAWLARVADWRTDHRLWIEAFVVFNLAGLVARHLPRPFREPLPPFERVHPARLLARRGAVLARWSCSAGPAARRLARRRTPDRLVRDRDRPRRTRPAPRQPLLPRADDPEPDLCGAVRGAARVHRTRPAARRQPHGRPFGDRLAALDAAAGGRAASSAISSSALPITR